MTDLHELERELGERLRAALHEVLDADRPPAAPPSRSVVLDETTALPAGLTSPRANPTGRRQLVGIAAAVVLLGGALAAATVLSRDTRVSNTIPPPIGTASTPTDPTPTSALPTPTDPTPLLLPTELPDGYSITDVAVSRDPAWRGHITRYLRTEGDGVPVAMVELSTHLLEAGDAAPDGSRVVHGQPANAFDDGMGWSVSWAEAERLVTVRSIGMSFEEVMALAEASVLDPASGNVALPDSLRGDLAPDLGPAPPADPLSASLALMPDDGQAGAWVSLAMTPNTDRLTLDSIELRLSNGGFAATARATVRGEEAVTATTAAAGEFGALNLVTWVEHGVVVGVSGRLATTELMELANGLGPASVDDARTLRAAVDARALALPSLGGATLPNGMHVSARAADGTGIDFLCLTEPIRRCEAAVSESSLAGEEQRSAALTFVVAGSTWLIGWADGVHDPHLSRDAVTGDRLVDVVVVDGATYFAAQIDDPTLNVVLDPSGFPAFGIGTPWGGAEQLV